ncbi:MAG: pilus assembly protein PilM [Dehalococcoidales bacterium]|nr:pilus assembly protein PilM [Dehalococcoidales bacterium]
MAGNVITLEISSTHLRLMETTGHKVVKWASRALEPGMFEGAVISDPQAVGKILRQFMKLSGINGSNAVIGISGLYSISRMVMVTDPTAGKTLQEVVLDAAKAVMPLAEEELYFSWQPVGTVEGGQQVMVVGVPRDVIDSEMRALKAAGLSPRIVELKAMSLIRTVNRRQALILNVEPSTFDTIIVVGGVAEVMRTTAWQPGELSMEARAEHLAVALDLAVGFYNAHHPDSPLDTAISLFVTGQMSGDAALMEKLKARVVYSIGQLAPLLEGPAHLPLSQYAVNIGLALRGTVPAEGPGEGGYLPLDINLLPQSYQQWKPSTKQIIFAGAMVVALAVLFPLFNITADAMKDTSIVKSRYDIFNSELQRRQQELARREPLQRAIDEYNSIVAMGGGVTEDLTVIDTAAENLGIILSSVSHEGKSITISCQAGDYIIFRNYIAALEASGRFSTPIPPPEGYPYIKGGTIKVEPKASE